ncbi:MAG: LamG-like jellyroll fold domain-containing protein, partial [Planctomycetota bacterium]
MCRKLIFLTSFVLVLGLTTTVANADIVDGLVGYWPLDEGGGTTTADASGNGSDGTLNGGPRWVEGKFGGALDFDGSDDHVNCGNSSILDFGTGDWTVSAWIKVATTPSGDVTIYGKGGDHSSDALPGVRYQMMLDSDNDIHPVLDNDNTKLDPRGDIPVIDGQWHHIVMMRRDGTQFRVYVDGIEDVGVTNHGESTIPANYDISGTSKFNAYIGAITHAGNSTPSTVVLEKLFPGLIDDVAVWNRALTLEEISYLWNNGVGNPVDVSNPAQASDPYPADEEADVLRDVVLSWTPGDFAPAINGHKVYLGENFNDVNDGIGGITQSASSYDPGGLGFGTTYYWRVDEVNGPPDNTVYEGEVWSFTTEPVGYAIENITATASSAHQADMGPENTINGSGLDANDLHSQEPTGMWLSAAEPLGAWIEFQFDKVYKLHEMWIWNSNQMVESLVGFGLKAVTIEHSANGTDWTAVADVPEFARAPGVGGYAHNSTIDLGGAAAKYVRLTATSNWGGIMPQFGLSEVRFFHIPVWAREPSPDSGATDVDVNVTLGFRAGRQAASHDVYLGTDEQAVTDGTTTVTAITETSYGPLSLDLGQTYYWRVDEANEAETPAMWQGELWDFTTQEYFAVDDFESYNDLNPEDPASNRIFNVWIDGYG